MLDGRADPVLVYKAFNLVVKPWMVYVQGFVVKVNELYQRKRLPSSSTSSAHDVLCCLKVMVGMNINGT